jgi:integrase
MGRAGQGVDVRETSIRVTFTLDGKQRRETLLVNGEPLAPTPPNIKYATRLAAEIRDRIRHGTFSMAEYFPASGAGAAPTSLSVWLDTWLAGQRLANSSRKAYASAIVLWKTTLGDKPLRALKTSDVLLAINTRAKLSGKTRNNYMDVLSAALDLAVLDKLMPDNPVHHVPRAKHQKPPVEPFTRDEADAILADMARHYPAQVVNFTRFKFFSGVRTGEAFGLPWTNVDLAAGHVIISQGVVQGEDVDRTKTSQARQVALNSIARGALVAQQAETLMRKGHVFHDPRYGARWAGERAFGRSYWAPTLLRLKMAYRPPYNTRHTYATMMLMAGMTPAFCAGQMGHSVEIFLTTYAKWIPGAGDKAEMAKLEQTLGAPRDRSFIPELSLKCKEAPRGAS